ncbi:5'-methylthioadenosine/adenosylhomocysteine nucleosidase [Borrelia miyamotoi]|uniref:adenosylhomocysteine nucleosidase n=1 Tax=Borrelia miyamotoi TaxID=47466 RepID=A0AAQ2WZ80_9SPIR|nr:5'-methylthioadenosine/adenosylhomocysteine nucleosidase [Borrelia miyamotoi]QTL84134.1 5'-methylthioadenosine/adenosylhomocysteine nucleosidase [Borrelia miyamotoi]WAZ85783.1 5'-methylthioadenosine/adenosylhomocysteine nucleosidase [Borrelia miyamotoi]WAZ91565.1 5'-methylthioadenosine/adenosylhomocysteine nucleosidase [Borrelia miyamotoi]WAZ92853.1 5'-methylthioadenosine/adenosylhomocysteine nucleosidase [Borrelia miyamotoi]WAZ94144.1 5'-methylthioadenosine/adenosylhomocysteine nucleosidas
MCSHKYLIFKLLIFLLIYSSGYAVSNKNSSVLIVFAMDSEANEINKIMSRKEEVVLKDYGINQKIVRGKISNRNVISAVVGIGKVNMGLWTSYLLSKYNISHVINCGVAGGVINPKMNKLKVGDIVVSSEVAYHDFDLVKFGHKVGQVPELPQRFSADRNLLEKALKAIKINLQDVNGYTGLILSGDQFIDSSYLANIVANFEDVVAVDMEGAAVGHVAHIFNVPFIVVRSISDIVNNEGNEVEYNEFLSLATLNAAKMVQEILRLL